MKNQIIKASLITAVCCLTTAAMAENPFVGTWKLDTSQSKSSGETISFASAPDGKLRIFNQNVSYVVATDGTPSTDPMNLTEVWTKIDDHTWKSAIKTGSTAGEANVYTLSSDGNNLDLVSESTKPNGDVSHDKESFTRVAPGNGLLGTWKSTTSSSSNPDVEVIDANGDDGIVIRLPQWNFSITLKFDGKEAPLTAPALRKA